MTGTDKHDFGFTTIKAEEVIKLLRKVTSSIAY